MNMLVQDWFYENSLIPARRTQYVLFLYDLKEKSASNFDKIARKMLRLQNIHLEVEHDLKSAFKKMGSFPFSYWRVILNDTYAKDFVAQQKEHMIRHHVCISCIVYDQTNCSDLSWARNNPELVRKTVSVLTKPS